MGRKVEPVTIDGVAYQIRQLGTSEGIPLGHRLLKAIGPVVVSFIEKLPAGSTVSDAQLGIVVIDAMKELPTELVTDLANVFKENTGYKDDAAPDFMPLKMVYDDHFAGRYGSWLRWFIACARVNFTGFFSSAGSS